MIVRKKISDIFTITLSFIALTFYYLVSILLVRSLVLSENAAVKWIMLFLITVIPSVIVIMVLIKSLIDLVERQVTGYLRIKILSITSIVFFLSIIVIGDIYFRLTKVDNSEKVAILGYREISEILGETLKLGGNSGIWNVSDLIDYINSISGVKYSEITDRSGRVLIRKYQEIKKNNQFYDKIFEESQIIIMDSTGVRIDTKPEGDVVVDLEYRAKDPLFTNIYYLSIGFQPVGYLKKTKENLNDPETVFSIFFYMITLTVLYLFAVISIYYITKDFNKSVYIFNNTIKNATIDNIIELKIFPELKNMQESIDSFNIFIKEIKQIRKNDAFKVRKQVWDEVAKRISHELKNPLTPIRLSSERLLLKYGKDDFEKVLKRSIQVILTQIDVIEQKITDFTDFSELPSLNMFSGSIIEPLHKSIDKFKTTNINADIIFSKKSSDDIILRDPYSLEFVFSNLLDICMKEMPIGDSISIELSDYYEDGKFLLLSIKNLNCELIYDKTTANYFDNRFSSYKYIVIAIRKIIDDHNGTFYISSDFSGILLSILMPQNHA